MRYFAQSPRVALSALLFSLSIAGQNGSAASLASLLGGKYRVSPVGPSGNRVLEESSVLLLRKPGLVGIQMGNTPIVAQTFKGGLLKSPSFILRALKNPESGSPLPIGERVYLVNIQVNIKGDSVTFVVFRCGDCTQVDPASLRAGVIFQFPKGFLKTANFAPVDEVIEEMFSVDTGVTPQPTGREQQVSGLYVFTTDSNNQVRLNADGSFWLRQNGQTFNGSFSLDGNKLTIQQDGRKPVSGGVLEGGRIIDPKGSTWVLQAQPEQAPGPIVSEVSIVEPPPPPEPPEVPPAKTIERGQSVEHVVAALGQPKKIVKLAPKLIYFYKDMKITFLNGKVSDVQ